MDSANELESVRHLRDLGYEDPLDVAARRRATEQTRDEGRRRAEAMLSGGQVDGAIGALGQLAAESPDWPVPRHLLARACWIAGRFDDARTHLDWLTHRGIETAHLALLRARVEFAQRRFEAALDQAGYARCLDEHLAGADALIGDVHYRRGSLGEADDAYRRELTLYPGSAAALAGAAAVALRRGDAERSADLALQSLARDFRSPAVHYRLGCALVQLGRTEEAVVALETAAKLQLDSAAPFRLLAKVAAEQWGDAARAEAYRREGRERLRGGARATRALSEAARASRPTAAS